MAILPPDPKFSLRHPDTGPIHSICFHQDQRLFAATKKGQVFLFDLNTNRSTYNFKIGDNPINSIHHTEDYMITQQKGGIINVQKLTNSGFVHHAKSDLKHVGFCRIDVNEKENLILAPENDNTVTALDLETLEERYKLQLDATHNDLGSVSSLKYFEFNGIKRALTGYENGTLLQWDLRYPSKSISSCNFSNGEMITAIDIDLTTGRGVTGNSGDHIYSFNISRQQQQQQQQQQSEIQLNMQHPQNSNGIHCLKLHADNKVFATACWDGRIRMHSWRTVRILAQLTTHKAEVLDIAFSKGKVPAWNKNMMAACGADGLITLWDCYIN